jgi:hypothetical protein
MEFDVLVDLVKTITRNKVKNIEILGNPGNDSRFVEALYDAISKGKVTSDESAIRVLYGKGEPLDSVGYSRTKSRLLRQLINTAFFVDIHQPLFNERAKAYHNCYRDFAAAQILIVREAGLAGAYLLEQVLEQSVKYEFVELTADIARYLRSQYARTAVDQSKHERIAKIHRQYEEKRRLEMLALDYHENLIHYYIVRRSPNEEVHRQASQYFDELRPLAEIADTSQFYHHFYQIGLIKYFAINDVVKILELCEEAFSVLQARKNTNRGALASLAGQKLACLTQLRRFDQNEGDETASYLLALSEEGSFNWYRSLELYLYYCLFSKRYPKALEIFKNASQQPRYKMLQGTARDTWQLFGGYFHLLALLGELDMEEVKDVAGEFRYAKISNEIELVDKDKEGMNIPLVLLPVIYNLVNNTFEGSNISVDALEKYRKRYLANDTNRRSAAFLNMLIAFAKKDYQSASAEKKIQKELQILSTEPPQLARQSFAVEIMPYEDLWTLMTKNKNGGRPQRFHQ